MTSMTNRTIRPDEVGLEDFRCDAIAPGSGVGQWQVRNYSNCFGDLSLIRRETEKLLCKNEKENIEEESRLSPES